MNIWIVSHAGGSPYHGPSMRTYYIAKNLIKLGHNLTLISSSYFHKYVHPPTVNHKIEHQDIDGINYVWLKTPRYKHGGIGQIINQVAYTKKLFFGFKKLHLPEPDILIASSPHPLVVFPAYRISRYFKCPYIFEMRNLWPLAIIEMGTVSKHHPYILLLEFAVRFGYRTSAHVVSINPGDIEYLSARSLLNPSKFSYIPNGFDVDSFSMPETGDAIRKIPRDKFIVGYTGAFTVSNSMMTLIKAAEKLDKWKEKIHFVLLGKGANKDKCIQYASRKNIDNISFIPAVPKSEAMAITSRYDVCYVGVANADVYTYGMSCSKVFDYMFLKKPILASINTKKEYDPIRLSGAGVTVDADNPEMVADAILRLYRESDTERRRFGRSGYDYLMKHHLFENIARQYDDLFKTLL